MYSQWITTDEAESLLSDYQDTISAASSLLNGYKLDLTTVEELADALQSGYELRFHLLLYVHTSTVSLSKTSLFIVQVQWMTTSHCIRMCLSFK